MPGDLAVLVPSRGRPDSIDALIGAFEKTGADSLLVVGIDEDERDLYPVRDVCYDIGPRIGMGPTLNKMAVSRAQEYEYLGFMGDDHRPRTPNWDTRVCQALREPGVSLVYGNDLFQGQNLPTAVFMRSEIVAKIGYMVAPGLTHLYIDNLWLQWGRRLGIRYMPDVIIEHMHPEAGKAEWDDRYRVVNSGEMYDHDARAFEEYMRTSYESDMAKFSG